MICFISFGEILLFNLKAKKKKKKKKLKKKKKKRKNGNKTKQNAIKHRQHQLREKMKSFLSKWYTTTIQWTRFFCSGFFFLSDRNACSDTTTAITITKRCTFSQAIRIVVEIACQNYVGESNEIPRAMQFRCCILRSADTARFHFRCTVFFSLFFLAFLSDLRFHSLVFAPLQSNCNHRLSEHHFECRN